MLSEKSKPLRNAQTYLNKIFSDSCKGSTQDVDISFFLLADINLSELFVEARCETEAGVTVTDDRRSNICRSSGSHVRPVHERETSHIFIIPKIKCSQAERLRGGSVGGSVVVWLQSASHLKGV